MLPSGSLGFLSTWSNSQGPLLAPTLASPTPAVRAGPSFCCPCTRGRAHSSVWHLLHVFLKCSHYRDRPRTPCLTGNTHYCLSSSRFCFFPPERLLVYEVCPEGIQPCARKNRDIYLRRYKIQETLYTGQQHLSPLQSRDLGTSHSSQNLHQLPCRIFLNLTDCLKPLLFQR